MTNTETQNRALDQTFRFLLNHARRAGFHDVVLTKISNSEDFNPLIEAFSKARGYSSEAMKLRLFNPLDSAHAVQSRLRKRGMPIQILIQDWKTTTSFKPDESLEFTKAITPVIHGREISQGELRRASTLFVHFLEKLAKARYKLFEQLSVFSEHADEGFGWVDKKSFMKALKKLRELGELSDHELETHGLDPKKYTTARFESSVDMPNDHNEFRNVIWLKRDEVDSAFPKKLVNALYNSDSVRDEFAEILRKNNFAEEDAVVLVNASQEMVADYELMELENKIGEDAHTRKLPATINSPVNAYSLRSLMGE